MCLVRKKNTGFMGMDMFRDLLDQIAASGMHFNTMLPFFRGESLLHPQF
jgi:hypothetical protein